MLRAPAAMALALAAGACHTDTHPDVRATAIAPTSLIRVVAGEYAFSNLTDTLQAGWHDFRVVNQGKQSHMAVIARLDSGRTVSDFLAAVRAKAAMPWLHEAGGVNAVLPGDSVTTAVNVPAGSYIAVCFVADSSGRVHLMDGMVSAFTVAATGTPAMPEPVGDDSVLLTSYRIAFASAPTAGTHMYRVQDVDSAHVNHDLVIIRLQEGKTAEDAMAWLATMRGTPPFTVAGASTGIETGGHDYIHLTLSPGNYLALCLMPDAADGKPHFMHGMTNAFTVAS